MEGHKAQIQGQACTNGHTNKKEDVQRQMGPTNRLGCMATTHCRPHIKACQLRDPGPLIIINNDHDDLSNDLDEMICTGTHHHNNNINTSSMSTHTIHSTVPKTVRVCERMGRE